MSPDASHSRPWKGLPTRGKTARNRLRRVDLLAALYDPALLRREDGNFAGAPFVDLGYGAEPFTTLETAERLRRVNPGLRVVGVEIDRERVAAAEPHADGLTTFRHGGFRMPLRPGADGPAGAARMVRAFNVFRQYPEEALPRALGEIALGMLPGGLLIEGTSDPFGRVFTANLFRRTADKSAAQPFTHEALVLGMRLAGGFDPAQVQAVLPKNYIHHVVPGEPIHAVFAAWKEAAAETRAHAAFGPRQWFRAAAAALPGKGVPLSPRPLFLRHNLLVISPPPSR